MPRAAFVYTDDYVRYHLSDTHPLQQKRLLMTHRLLDAYGAFDRPDSDLIAPTPATEADLLRVHSQEYLDALWNLSEGRAVPDRKRFGFGSSDNPPFPGMWEASLLYAGGSLDCARLVSEGGYDAAFNTSGGLHHAQRDRAAGFCTVNDCALVAHYLLERGAARVAYVDIDAHHGDGTQALFYHDPRVLTLSIHETPETLFPRVMGFADEIGEGAGFGYNANLPLAPGSGDAVASEAFEAVFLPLLRAFNPDYIILQVGADAHFQDPLAHLCLTTRGWLGLAQSVLALRKPVVALGGGGYNLKTVARLWTLLYGTLSGQAFPQAVPPAYADEWGVTHLHDTSEPSTDEAALVFDQVYRRRHAASAVTDARAYTRQGAEIIRERVFPAHGINDVP
jgi:acetoin utilization protein AcuC